MEPVRWGILSTARINHAVLEPARETEKAEVIAVASRVTGRAQSYAREHGIERAYGSYEELLEDPDVEAAYNSLPNSMHVDWSIRALEAVRPAGGATPILVQVLARDMEHRLDVEIPLAFPQLQEIDVLGVPEQPGGFVVERLGAFFQLADAQGDAEALALSTEAAAGRNG